MEWGGLERVWSASPSLTCPSPNKHRAGQGRGGPLLSPGFLCPPQPRPWGHQPLHPTPQLGTWFGSCRAGLLAPGYEPVNPSCVWTFLPVAGPELSFSSFWGGGRGNFIYFLFPISASPSSLFPVLN